MTTISSFRSTAGAALVSAEVVLVRSLRSDMVLSSMVVVAGMFPGHRVLVLTDAGVDCFDLRANTRCSADTLPPRERMGSGCRGSCGSFLPIRSCTIYSDTSYKYSREPNVKPSDLI